HAPTFTGNEKKYVTETIDSTFVSSVGKFVDEFERKMEAFTGTPRAVATVNGTAALHAALYMAGVRANDLVITQALTFVATC
ncbi:DegT/DnrJ/EryC1/StrS family aminotransferase, partial [Escherichia coli]|nr:DegT/DnrJ/EryC1/StrS family aminotransferase [Escherichia coli]